MGSTLGRNDIVNAAGSTLPAGSLDIVQGQSSAAAGFAAHDDPSAAGALAFQDPARRATLFLNWLTAGGAPKPVDPGSIFTQAQATAPAQQAAAKGQGIGGLFGTGSIIGEIAPPVQALRPLQGIKPMNTSPLQPGVPYSVPALPKVGGR